MSRFASGAIWVTITSSLGMVASYINTLLASNIGDSATTLSFYALLLLLIQTVSTFGILGGNSAFSQNLPSFSTQEEKNKFFTSIFLISTILIFLVAIIYVYFSNFLLKGNPISSQLLFCFIIIIFLQQLLLFILPAIGSYRDYAIFIALMPITICIYLSFVYFTGADVNVELGIIITCFISLLISIIISAKKVMKEVSFVVVQFSEVIFFARKALSVHLITLVSFLYFALDQYLISFLLGSTALATYFLSLQVSQLVRFVPLKLGQLFLSSFSRAIKNDNTQELLTLYKKSSFILVLISNIIVITSLCYADEIKVLFGEVGKNSENLIFFMCFIMSLGSMGPINSMLVLAYKKNRQFLTVNIVVLSVNFICFLALFQSKGLLAIFIAKLASMVVGQLGNWLIIFKVWGGVPKDVVMNYLIGILLIIIAYINISNELQHIFFASFIVLNFMISMFFYSRVKNENN